MLSVRRETDRFELVRDGLVLGWLTLEPGRLTGIWVQEAWRRKGYGTYLYRQALKQSGIGPKERLTAPDSAALRPFLEKFGFRPQDGQLMRCAPVQRNALSIVHGFLAQHLGPGMFAVDATAGNGHDTAFLCGLVGPTGRVLAMDIQPAAVQATRQRLASLGYGQAQVVCDSHANLAHYARPGTVDGAVFNLGYLPGADHGVFTVPQTSIPALKTALELLRPGGVLTVCVYAGGRQGTVERDAVLAFVRDLPSSRYQVEVELFSDRPGLPPVPICIKKRVPC